MLCCPVVAVVAHSSCHCAGNGDPSSAAPAEDSNPLPGHAAGTPAVGSFTSPSAGANFGFSSFPSTTASTSTFGGVSGTTGAGSASATAEGRGKATGGNRTGGRNKAVRVKSRAKVAISANAATAGAEPAPAPLLVAEQLTTEKPLTCKGVCATEAE